MYSINFTKNNAKFCLSLHDNGSNSDLFINGKEIQKFKTKDSEIIAAPLCLGNISKDFTIGNMKKTGCNRHIYDFSVDYKAIVVENILSIHKYLMGKFGFIKKVLFAAMTFFDFNLSNVNSLECVSMNNQECKTGTKIININNNEPVFYPFNIKVNKCSGSCNKINDPYAWSNQTKHIEWHET